LGDYLQESASFRGVGVTLSSFLKFLIFLISRVFKYSQEVDPSGGKRSEEWFNHATRVGTHGISL
jgi:hypothetical protein